MARRVRSTGQLLGSPVFAGSIGLLLLNDHVLKAAWPGPVTGKLSDIAGVVMVAIAVTALLRRAGVAFGLTATAFAALKTVPAAAVWVEPVLGGVTRTDATDLVALLALVPLWVWVHRRGGASFDAGVWAAPVRVALIGAAVFATSATSCDIAGVTDVTEHEGVLYAVDAGGTVFASADGLAWERVAGDRVGAGSPTGGWMKRYDCAGGRCFVIEGSAAGVAVVEVGDGPPLLELTRDQQLALTDVAPQQSCSDVSLFHLDAFERDDGVHLVVSAGSAGVLVMDAGGGWRWAAVGEWGIAAETPPSVRLGLDVASEPDDRGPRWGRVVAALLPAGVLVAAVVAAAALAVRWKRRNGKWGVVVGTVVGLGIPYAVIYGALVASAAEGGGNDLGVSITYVALAGFGAVGFAMALAIANKWARPPEPRPLPAPAGPDRVG